MRNRVLWSVPHVRFYLVLPALLLLTALALAGCGGGGGGGGNNNNNNNNNNNGTVFTPPASTGSGLTTVYGQVLDFNNKAVVGATVTIPGAGAGQTDANGNFYVQNVPLTATRFYLTLPSGYSTLGYYPSSSHTGVYTDQTCGGMHLPALQAGLTPLAGDTPLVSVYTSDSPAAPPPPQSPCI